MRYVASVSYPRSGHHLIVRLMQAYFGESFTYCQFYGQPPDACCQEFPCARPGIMCTKNHDMELEVELPGIDANADVPVLVGVRHFMDAVVSDYEQHVRIGNPDSLQEWRSLAGVKAAYYTAFVNKWVAAPRRAERCILKYEEIVTAPEQTVARVIRFFDPAAEVDHDRLARCLADTARESINEHNDVVLEQGHGIAAPRRVETFRYFDPKIFGRIEGCVADALRLLDYPLRYPAPV